jgi:hypothetical protein
MLLGQVLYWCSLCIAMYVVQQNFARSYWLYLLVSLLVVSRMVSYVEIPGAYSMYILFMLMLFASAGASLILQAPQIVNTQAKVFFILSFPVMILQISGFSEWVQTFNTLYNITNSDGAIIHSEFFLLPLFNTPEDFLIANYTSDYFQYLSMQSRPPGLTHSSAMLAVFILSGTALHLGRLRGKQVRFYDLVLVSVVVFSGAKLALLGFIAIVFQAILGASRKIRFRLISILCLLLIVLLLYSFIFPASINHNFGLGAFEASFLTRAIDAAVAVNLDLVEEPYVIDIMGRYPTLLNSDSIESGGLSGAVGFLTFLPFVLIIVFAISSVVAKGFRICNKFLPDRAKISKLMVLVLLVVPFASNMFNTPFYGLCIGITILPIIIGLSPRIRNHLLH